MLRTIGILVMAVVLMTVIAGTASAYRLICIPSPEVLPEGMYKLELAEPYNDTLDKWLPCYRFDATLFKDFEVAVKVGAEATSSGWPWDWTPANTQINLTYQIAKEKGETPSLGIGVWNLYDSDDHAALQESFFIGAAKTVDLGLPLPCKVILGIGNEQLNGLFGGIAVPITKDFSLALEYIPDPESGNKGLNPPGTDRFNWALGYNYTENWRFKYANLGGDSALGVVYTNWLYSKSK